jgi:hypothetical protein
VERRLDCRFLRAQGQALKGEKGKNDKNVSDFGFVAIVLQQSVGRANRFYLCCSAS